MLLLGFIVGDSSNKDTSFTWVESYHFAEKTTQEKKMLNRALCPPNPSLSNTLLPPPDDALSKARPQGSRVTKTEPRNRIIKTHSVPSRSTKPDNSPQFSAKNLPNASWFQPIVQQQSLHKAYNELPAALRNIDVIEPHLIIQLFFSDEIFETICMNTNLYAANKKAKKSDRSREGPREKVSSYVS